MTSGRDFLSTVRAAMREQDSALVEAVECVLYENDFRRVIIQIMKSAQRLLKAEAASLFLVNRRTRHLEMAASTNLPRRMERLIKFPIGIGVAGWVAEHGQSVNVENIVHDRRHYEGVTKLTGYQTKGYLSVPLKVGSQILGTIQVLNQTQGGKFTEEDQALLEGFSVIAALALRKNQMHAVALEKKRIQGELAVANAFQQKMLPSVFDPPETIRIDGYNRPARQMGGDIYDAFAFSTGYCFLVGDVSGKGPGAALWMASLSNLLHFLAHQGKNPMTEIHVIDQHLANTMPSGLFITLFICTIEGGMLRYTGAGHNPALHISKNGTLSELQSSGLPLALMPDLPREIHEIELKPGDRLVLYSDGVVEAENQSGDMYELSRLQSICMRSRKESPTEMITKIRRSVGRFTGGAEQSDDITLLIVAANEEREKNL